MREHRVTEPEYAHTQRSPLCWLLYGVAAMFLVLGWWMREIPPIAWLFPPIGMLMLVVAASFHHLSVVDLGDVLAIRFGPLPLFRKTVHYGDIVGAEVGRTLLIDGWGIHLSIRGGWVWNLWGRDCVVVRCQGGRTLRIGTDDAANLANFLVGKIRHRDAPSDSDSSR